MAPWVVSILCALVILKPQEFVEALAGLPLIYVVFGAGVVLAFVDVIWKRIKPAMAPHIPWVLGFFLWAVITTAVKRPDALEKEATRIAIVAAVFLLIAIGASSSWGVRVFAATFLGCGLLVSIVALEQGLSPMGCMLAAPEDWEGRGELEYDGRACEDVLECKKDAPVEDGNYRCERVGPWKTSSIGGRIRYRGSLADPNELSLMAGMAVPFALAFTEGMRRRRDEPRPRRRASDPPVPPEPPRPAEKSRLPMLVSDGLLRKIGLLARSIPMLAVLALIGIVVVMSKSRTGVIVYLIVVGLYFIRRAGAWGVVAGFIVGPPMLLLGGRGGDEADASSTERVELLYEAFDMIRDTKGIGVGAGQFADESSIGLTAHNSYVLAAAEAGLIGMFLFCMATYLAVKVPFKIWFGRYQVDSTITRFAPALAVSLCGAVAGIFFLSWSYKDVLYMMFGASAALYAAAKAQDPTVKVSLSFKEGFFVGVGTFVLLAVLFVVTRLKV
jgi:O-antigen ligase